jgi:hypothetical protein
MGSAISSPGVLFRYPFHKGDIGLLFRGQMYVRHFNEQLPVQYKDTVEYRILKKRENEL